MTTTGGSSWRRICRRRLSTATPAPVSRCRTRAGEYGDVPASGMSGGGRSVRFVSDLDAVAPGAPFGVAWPEVLSGATAANVLDRVDRAGCAEHLVAIRCPFNVFEAVPSEVVDLVSSRGVTLVADRALLLKNRRPGSSQATFTKLRSTLSPHAEMDLVKLVRNGFNSIMYLESQARKADNLPADVREGLTWAHRMAAKYDQIMNLYVWERALRDRIRPSLDRALEYLHADKARTDWASRYKEAFETFLYRFTLAVEHAAFHENAAVNALLDEACPALRHIECVETKAATIIHAAGADVLFSPDSTIDVSFAGAFALSREDARQALKVIADAPRLYFEETEGEKTVALLPC